MVVAALHLGDRSGEAGDDLLPQPTEAALPLLGADRPHRDDPGHDDDRPCQPQGEPYTGQGDVFETDKMVPIKTGGVMFHPAGLHHYDGARDGEVIVQIVGIGPVSTTDTEKK